MPCAVNIESWPEHTCQKQKPDCDSLQAKIPSARTKLAKRKKRWNMILRRGMPRVSRPRARKAFRVFGVDGWYQRLEVTLLETLAAITHEATSLPSASEAHPGLPHLSGKVFDCSKSPVKRSRAFAWFSVEYSRVVGVQLPENPRCLRRRLQTTHLGATGAMESLLDGVR